MIRLARPRRAAQLLLGMVLSIAAATEAAVVQQSQMLGRYVLDPAGKSVGELRDFVIDMREGRAVFALLWVPGRSGGGRFATYPLPAKLQPENNAFKLDSGKDRIDELPGFGPGEEPNFESPEFAGLVRPGPAGIAPWPGDDTGPRYRRATTLLDSEIKQPSGAARAATVKDLMLDTDSGQLRAVVIEFDPAWFKASGWVGIPPQSTKRQGNTLVATFNPKDMQPASPDAGQQKAAADAPPALDPNRIDRDFRATQLIGASFVDSKGAAIGKVADLVFDSKNGKVSQVVLDVGGKQVGYPLPLTDAKVSGDNVMLGDVAKDKVQTLGPPVPEGPGTQRMGAAVKTTKIIDDRNQPAGSVRELVVNLYRGEVRYAVLELPPTWLSEQYLVALNLREITPAKDGGLMMKVANSNELGRGMLIEKARWPDFGSPEYRATVQATFSR